MTKSVSIALGATAMAALIGAPSGGTAPDQAAYRNPTVGREVALQIPGMNRAKVKRNIAFRRTGGRVLKLDVYYPASFRASARLPAVIFVHGGTNDPSPKDWGEYVGWGQLAAASGLIGITFNHTDFDFADTAALVAYVRKHGGRLGIDADRLCLKGHSMGVPAATSVGMRGYPAYVRCVVAYYGPLDSRPVYRQPSPLEHLRSNPEAVPPMLVAKASSDSEAINTSIDDFVAEAKDSEAPVRLVTYQGGVHAFDTRQKTRRSRQIIHATLSFLREELLSS